MQHRTQKHRNSAAPLPLRVASCGLMAAVLLQLLAPPATAQRGSGPTTPPNVVIIMADDLGYGDVGAFGGQVIATPRIDDLCASGMRLDSFYAHATCTPTRAALLTGRYAHRVGLPGPVGAWSPRGLAPDEVTIAEVLKTVAYRTATFGKWHVGDAPEHQPTAQGFDEFRGILWGPTGIPLVLADSTLGALEYEPSLSLNTIDVTAHTLDFIDRSVAAAEPFLCFASYIAPHEPATASPGFRGISADGRDYGDSVEELDASVGAIVDRLASLNVLQDTVVIFLSDNGAVYQRIPYQDGNNFPFSFGKGSTWEGGVRVPACISWPGRIPSGSIQGAPFSITDLMPTIARWAGARLDPTIKLDGLDVAAVFEGGAPDPARVVHLAHKSGFEAVRRGRFKYRLGELYDLDVDPEELVDVSASFPAEAAELAIELSAIQASILADTRPITGTSRLTARFRADSGVQTPVMDGTLWFSTTTDSLRLKLVDTDPILDAELIDTVRQGTFNTPQRAMHLGGYTDRIRLEGTVPGLAPGGPFSLAIWYRLPAAGLTEEIVVVDVGDHQAGLSFTIGDAGVLGDDSAAGQLDDLLVRIGGSLSPNSSTVAIDLPDSPAVPFLHLSAVMFEEGELIIYVNGIKAGSVTTDAVDAGLDRTWAFLAAHGAVGGSAGPGVWPFATTRSTGDLGGVTVVDRALRRNEVEADYVRYVQTAYCLGRPNLTGQPATFRLNGSFRRADNRLSLEVSDLPSFSFGFMLGSQVQHRTNIGNGTLCLDSPVLRFSRQIYQSNLSGRIDARMDLNLAPVQVLDTLNGTWNFQYWYRDGFSSNFSNAVRVSFGG